ncbi:MAG: GEVED domain-containing protein [Chitinophagaceae bacterium]
MKKIYAFLVLLMFSMSVKSQTDFTIGSATGANTTSTYPCPIQDFYEGSRAQYLYLASELQAAGMSAGFINSIKFNVISITAPTTANPFTDIEEYTISIGSTATASLDPTTWETGTIVAFGPATHTPTVGINEFILTTPFFWNGTDNIILDICNGDPNNGNTGLTTWTNNIICPWTSGLSFNGSHSNRSDNNGNLCGTTTVVENGTPTTRPDVIFTWNSPVACTGVPLGGTAESTKDTVCAGKNFNLFTLGSTLGSGLTYQWQDSVPGVSSSFTDIPGATGFSYPVVGGISVAKYFRRKITCAGNTRISTAKYVFVRPFYECYCSPIINNSLHTTSTTALIESVSLVGGTLNYTNSHPGSNAAPTLGYAYFTDTTGVNNPPIPAVRQAGTYTLTITTSTTPNTNSCGYWVDWNHNQTYDSAEYVNVPFVAGNLSADIVVEIPANAPLGLTMFRVRTSNFGFNYGSSCASFGNGETEDYIFRVLPGVPCAGTPLGGTTESSVTGICPNKPFSLSVANATEGVTNLAYQWQDSTATHNWADITVAKSKTYSVAGITVDTWYRRKITCTNSSASAFSDKIAVPINPLFDCYCSPLNGVSLHSSTSPSIENIAIDGGNPPAVPTLNYANANPGVNTSTTSLGYTIFNDTTQSPVLAQEIPYTLTVTASATPQQAAVWIDYDHSGTLDPSEMQNIPFAAGATTATITITPPSNSVLGFTMMRVRIRVASFTTSCENFGSGETEDYVIKIVPGSSCTGKPVGGSAAASTATSCNGIPVALSVTGATEGYIGLSYQWQDSIPGVSTKFTDRSLDTNANLTALQSVAKYYRRKIKCRFSADSSYSTPVFVDQLLVTYATIPYTEDFENTWEDGCGDVGSRTVPNNSWRSYPLMGDSSWRRNDDASAANWINPNSGVYAPTSSTGTYSARFHTYQATFGTSGNFDLYLNCSGGSPIKRLSFDYINTSGTDSVQIFLSQDGGLTFTKIDTFRNATNWTTKTVDFNSSSATSVIRFRATSDFGVTDIGIDNLSIIRLNAVDLAATSVVSPTGSFSITPSGNITVSITNFGAIPINFATTNATVGARVTPPSGAPVVYSKLLNTGVLAAGASQNVLITNTADFNTIGSYCIKGGVAVNGDANALNDSTTNSCVNTTSLVIYAIANGNWGNGSTWSTGTIPTAVDTVTITGFNVSLGGTSPSPYSCSSLGVGNGGTLTVQTGTLNVGVSGGGNKALTFARGATLNISGGTVNLNGFVLFNDSSNFVMSSGNFNIDGNNGTDAGSVPAGTDLLGFGTAAKTFSFGNINVTGGTITIADPHRFNGNVIGYRGSVARNIGSGNIVVLGDGVSNQTSVTGIGGFAVNCLLSSSRLSLGSIVVNGGNSIGNRFTTFGSNIGINGDLTINANSELRSTFTAYLSGNFTNNGIWATSTPPNFQSYLNGVTAPVTTGQTISGNGIYRNNVPSITVVATGTGYSVGDILTIPGGTFSTPAAVYVLSVGGTGSIISAVLLNAGNYTVAPTGAQSVTGGTGSGATFNVTNFLTTAKFAGMAFNNTSAAGVTISSLGTTLPSQTGTISGTSVLTMIAGIINNGNNVITLGNSLVQRGSLNYTSGFISGKFRRWFTTATNTTTSGDFPVGKGTYAKTARVEFTTAPNKGGTLTVEYIATPPTLSGFPLLDGAMNMVNINNNGFWRIETDSITGGTYTVSLTDTDSSSIVTQTLTTLRSVKRAHNATNWSLEGTAGTNTGSLTKPVVVRTGLTNFSEYAIAGAADNLLPFTSLKFTGEKVGNANQLNWVVLNEIDVKSYELQRGTTINSFEKIANISSKSVGNNNSSLSYSFVDNNSISKDAYYRLKQIAKDGSILYSNVISIKGARVNGIVMGNVYPNPTRDLLNVTVATSTAKNANVIITDLLGKVVLKTARTLTQGDNNLQVNVEKLSAGNYTIHIVDADGKKSDLISFVKE